MSADGGLRNLFRDKLRDFHWQSIETGGTGRGVPDLNGCLRGVELWVECKVTAGWAVTLRPEQIGWLCRRARAGGRVFVAVRRCCPSGPRRTAADELWLLLGHHAPDLRTGGLPRGPSRAVLGMWPGGPARWPWPAVRAALLA